MSLPNRAPETLEQEIARHSRHIARKENMKLKIKGYGFDLSEILEAVCDKYKEKAVVLIDEYDDPVCSYLEKNSLPKKIIDFPLILFGLQKIR
jgi:hypothetical protein